MLPLYIGFGLIVFLIILKNKGERSTSLNIRKKQTSSWTSKNTLSTLIEKNLEGKVKVTKKMDIEDLCYRAGYIMDYYVFLTYRIVAAILFGIATQMIVKNIFLSIALFFVGFFTPLEYMKFFANRRSKNLNTQIGVAMKMITKRYENTSDMKEAIEKTAKDMYGDEPIYTELTRLLDDINMGVSIEEAMNTSSRRMGNKFFERFTAFYGVSSDAGTKETKSELLNQAIAQYEENETIKRKLVKALREPVATAYIMIAAVPFSVLAGSGSVENYKQVMTQTLPGKIMTAFIVVSLAFSIWFVNTKLQAPIEVVKKKKKKKV